MAKSNETLSLELDGKINLVTRKGRKVTREEIDGMLCLQAILRAITDGLERMDKDRP